MARSSPRKDAANNAPYTNEADPVLAASVNANHDPEAAPLLVHRQTPRKATPLPLLQLLILAVVRLAEPIGLSQVRLKSLCQVSTHPATSHSSIGAQIFPYINQVMNFAKENCRLSANVGRAMYHVDDRGPRHCCSD